MKLEPRALTREQRAFIARRSLFLTSLIAALVAATVAALAVVADTRVVLGVLAGSAVAFACGLSWILGAVATFDGPFRRFARATLGVAPLRFAVVAISICGLTWFAKDSVDPAALALSFVAVTLLCQIAQADTFSRLASATSPYTREVPKARFSGLRFW